MKTKRVFYTELAYAIGITVLALGTALMERADFGMSMVVAPAYLLHLKVSEFLPWYSFGVSEYVLQAVLLAVLSLMMRKFKKGVFFLLYYGNSLWFSVGSVHLCRCTDRSSRHGVSHCLLFSWDALLRGGCGAAVSYLHCAGGLRAVRQGAGGEMRKGHRPGQDDLRLCQLPDRNRAVLCVFRIRTV